MSRSRRWFRVVGGVLLVGGLLGVALRGPVLEFVMDRMTADMFVQTDSDAWNPGLPLGAVAPAVSVSFQNTVIHTLEGFHGANGLLLFFNRSVDW